MCDLENDMRGMKNSRSRYIIAEKDGIDQVVDAEENYTNPSW